MGSDGRKVKEEEIPQAEKGPSSRAPDPFGIFFSISLLLFYPLFSFLFAFCPFLSLF